MKKIIITLLFASTFFVACDDIDTANVSQLTNYPIITVTGDNPIYVPLGGTYTDPGAVALEGTEEIQTTQTYLGMYRGDKTINTNKADQYTETYTAVNKDGFSASSTRTVIVYQNGDLVNSIEGLYTCTISRNGITPSDKYKNIKYVFIWKNTDGTYEVSDAFGGWYQYGRGLGVDYITPGGTINAIDIPTNQFTFPGNPLTNNGFGGVADMIDMTVNPSTKQIVFTTNWNVGTAYTFVATLTQVQP